MALFTLDVKRIKGAAHKKNGDFDGTCKQALNVWGGGSLLWCDLICIVSQNPFESQSESSSVNKPLTVALVMEK